MGTVVTRSGQITLDKKLRDELGIKVGTPLETNRLGDMIIIAKKNRSVWRKSVGFLPKEFSNTLKSTKKDYRERLKKLKVL